MDSLVAQANNPHLYVTGDQFPWTTYQQRAIPTQLSIGMYILRITLYADDVEPKTVYISIEWGGNNQKDVKAALHGNLQSAKHWFK